LEVARVHTFTVGSGQWVVHNACGGFGKLEGVSLNVSRKGIDAIKTHLSNPLFLEGGEMAPQNAAMVSRLENALATGSKISGADAVFYTHELYEYTLMKGGLYMEETYRAAHEAALTKYGASPFSVYHPAVIQKYQGWFNLNWFKFWGLE
jgi:hypothetical protein